MRILVVVGYCLSVNSSANLCHLKYIDGLLQCGHEVDLLTVSKHGLRIDESIHLPNVTRTVSFRASLYERKGSKSNTTSTAQNIEAGNEAGSFKKTVKNTIKSAIRKMYGVYGTEIGWMLRALLFQDHGEYDLVISLAYPPVSHRTTELLRKLKRIKTKRWIQIWEDPWYTDLCGKDNSEDIRKEEQRIVAQADQVLYVSPLTLENQRKFFPESSDKMYWQPLPSYYNEKDTIVDFSEIHFGYFGDYTDTVRKLDVFYQYAVDNGLRVTICGNSNHPFSSQKDVSVFARMPLNELKIHEKNTNVLVVVCNIGGGQIPGKVYQYAATNKYVLFILDGSPYECKVLYDFFKKYHRFVFCANNPKSIHEAVARITSGDLPDSYRTAIDDFSPDKIIHKIIMGENATEGE